jgi:imidazoleglycerol-phosphate dehydratase
MEQKMSKRTAAIKRATGETSVEINLCLEGDGRADVSTGIGFLDHMLHLLAHHSRFDISLTAKGDLAVDEHHTVEDVAIVLGKALNQALGERQGIVRMAHAFVPMDEALAMVALDLSGRGYFVFQGEFDGPTVGQVHTSLIPHFLETLAGEARMNLHVHLLSGRDDHHRAEAIFKALARALDAAVRIDPRLQGAIPSSKGLLEI